MNESGKFALVLGLAAAYQRTLRFRGIRTGEVNRASHTAISAAGKGVNVARALHTLGCPVELITFLGSTTGEWIRRRLAVEEIACRCVPTEAATRICQTLIDERSGVVTELVEEMTPPRPCEWHQFQMAYSAALERASIVVVAGTLPPGAPTTLYGELARQAQACEVPFVIDSHGTPLWSALPFAPSGVKCNRMELGLTVSASVAGDTGLVAAARRMQDEGADPLLVTDGAACAWWFDGERVVRLQPPEIHPVNPIGSGDAVTAGWVAGMLRGDSPFIAIRRGLACGTANALTDIPGEFDPLTVDKLMAEVQTIRPEKQA